MKSIIQNFDLIKVQLGGAVVEIEMQHSSVQDTQETVIRLTRPEEISSKEEPCHLSISDEQPWEDLMDICQDYDDDDDHSTIVDDSKSQYNQAMIKGDRNSCPKCNLENSIYDEDTMDFEYQFPSLR